MPISAPIVTTPVPPIPVTTISNGLSKFISFGLGNLLKNTNWKKL